jgi:hypothetical protein
MKFLCVFYTCFILSAIGCLDKQNNQCESVAFAAVTDVTGPSTTTIAQPATFRMTFAVNNGCGKYDSYETLTEADTTEVYVKARYIGCICTQQISYLQKDFVFTPTGPGTHYLKFFISGQQFLTKTLGVQ